MTATLEVVTDVPAWAEPLLNPMRYKGASGGRGSGKSHFFAELAVEEMVCDADLRFACIREVQRSLEFSAKSLVEKKIRKMGVGDLFEVQKNKILRIGGTGVMIFEGMQDHTSDSIKSLDGFKRAWVEEAQSLSQRSIDLLLPTFREDGSEIWFSWNPYHNTDAVDAMFAKGLEDSVRVHTTYRDNPFCPEVLRKEAERMQRADPEAYEHIWGGGYYFGGNGRVYSNFSPKPWPEGNVDESVVDNGAELYVGQDFNVNPMCSVIAVKNADECHVIDALAIETSNTAEVAKEIARRYPNRKVVFCPDPAGNARSTKTSVVGQTDFTILRAAGFEVRAPLAAPLVVDRINNVQAMCLDTDTGRRRLRVHPRAQVYITSMTMQTYKKDTSEPDKKSGHDHPNDAGGYLQWQIFNVLKEVMRSYGRTARPMNRK